MKKVLVCGSRHWNNWAKMKARLDRFTEMVCIVEGEQTGADIMAKQWAIGKKWPYTAVPADWKKHGNKAGPIRNRIMLDMLSLGSGDEVIGFHEDFENSKGTKDCVLEAIRRGFPAEVVS